MNIKYGVILIIMLIAGCTNDDQESNKKEQLKQTIDSTRTSKDVKSESSLVVPGQKNDELAEQTRFVRMRRYDIVEAKSYLVSLKRELVLQRQMKTPEKKITHLPSG